MWSLFVLNQRFSGAATNLKLDYYEYIHIYVHLIIVISMETILKLDCLHTVSLRLHRYSFFSLKNASHSLTRVITQEGFIIWDIY